jgi:hypothetical protein
VLNGGIEEKFNFIFKEIIKIFENDVVYIGSEMADGSIEKMKVALDAEFFEFGSGGGIKFCAFAAVGHVNFVNIAHELKGFFLADIFKKGSAEIVGDVIFSVGKSARSAETAHDGTGFAADAGFDFFTVDGAAAFFKGMSRFENRNFKFGFLFNKFKSGKNSAGACADYNNVIIHKNTSERFLTDELYHLKQPFSSKEEK